MALVCDAGGCRSQWSVLRRNGANVSFHRMMASRMMAQDERSILTLSSRSEESVVTKRRWLNPQLQERCTMQDMEQLKQAFADKVRGRMFPQELRNLLRDLMNVEYDDEEFKLLFMKINSSRDGVIDWDQFVSFLLMGCFTNDPDNQSDQLEPPIMGFPRVLSSMHRHPISRICFCPDVAKDRSTNMLQGSYVTASSDGMIHWWSLHMTLRRTEYSKSPNLKMHSTWVTDMVCMPDMNIIVTSSTERELRFYDCTARTFVLKIIITSWQYMICTMYYTFFKDKKESCMLICGDVGGNIRILLFSPVNRGPFQSVASRPLIQLRHVDLQKRPKMLPSIRLVELTNVHNEWVRQVSFYSSLHCVVSCATCPDSLLMCDIAGSKTHNMFSVEKGIQCFAFDEDTHVLVTGGPDCTVRVWNSFVPTKPNLVLSGHHAGIIAIVLQDHGQMVYSLARDRAIKVWDISAQVCIQTYIDIPTLMGERTPMSAVYNPATRELILGSLRIAVITLNEQLNSLHTDGFTHSRGVSKVLYNPLFKIVITCGMDSIIINWNPKTGRRNLIIRDAHTRLLHAELIPVEITAACFDPAYQLLLTGARNGTLKVWNFNSGACLRNMEIEYMMEVTSVFWTEGRMFAVGWNRHVVEFEDKGMERTGKPWDTRHTDDVLCAAVRSPLSVATASYNSELIFWKLETGQAYRRYLCTDPSLRINMVYNKREMQRQQQQQSAPLTAADLRRPSVLRKPSFMQTSLREAPNKNAAVEKAKARRVSTVSVPTRVMNLRMTAVHAMVFLETRPFSATVASLMVSLESGQIQAWSDHSAGGLQGAFQGIHTAGDYVSTLATDVDNDYLFTGTTMGYVKVWLMKNYCAGKEVHVSMPALRLEFPFLWRDRIEGRAKRSVRDQALPLLLNSYRAHMRCITSMAYIDESKLLLSGSSDYSVRIWRLTGEYLQTLGGVVPWTLEKTRFPPDVHKVASFTTLKVWRGGFVSRYVPGQPVVDKLRDITEAELAAEPYGARPTEPVLGKYFQLPPRPDYHDDIKLDDSLPTVPLYVHLRTWRALAVRRPPTPELVRRTRLRRLLVLDDIKRVRTQSQQDNTEVTEQNKK